MRSANLPGEIDRFPLAHLPTPLEQSRQLTEWLQGPDIWIKRDDMTGFGGGGNKVRKLEYLAADAIKSGATWLLTAGGIQSNHVRQTAAAAAKLGLRCGVVLQAPAQEMASEFYATGNILLDSLFDAEIRHIPAEASIDDALEQWASALEGQGERPYPIPVGGSNPLGALGYVHCATEIVAQAREWASRPTAIVLPTGSAGTQAGLLVGLALAGWDDVPVIGVCVSRASPEQDAKVWELVQQTFQFLGRDNLLQRSSVLTFDGAVGAGYGLPTPGMTEAVREVARRAGMLLDPVYTGKGFAGLISLCRSGDFLRGDRIIFLHTGGAPALFAYPEIARDA